jgi:hypothetical protein
LVSSYINRKQNMFEDGVCLQINNDTAGGWRTLESDDWTYYPQQYGRHMQ